MILNHPWALLLIWVLVQSSTMIQISILSVDTAVHCVMVAGGCIQFISIVGIRHISRYLPTRGMTRCQASTRTRYDRRTAPWQSSPLTLMVFCSLACAAPGPESGAPPVSQSNYHQDNLNQITRQDISHMWTLSRGRQLASDLQAMFDKTSTLYIHTFKCKSEESRHCQPSTFAYRSGWAWKNTCLMKWWFTRHILSWQYCNNTVNSNKGEERCTEISSFPHKTDLLNGIFQGGRRNGKQLRRFDRDYNKVSAKAGDRALSDLVSRGHDSAVQTPAAEEVRPRQCHS